MDGRPRGVVGERRGKVRRARTALKGTNGHVPCRAASTATRPARRGVAWCAGLRRGWLATLLALSPPDVRGQTPQPPDELVVPTGAVVERIVTAAHPDQSYALYLPAAYEETRTWPTLFVMDPRGRAPMALDIFRAGAEASGWIVVSAYGTRSDEPEDPNADAFNALFADVQSRFQVDAGRLYLAGFSGTARVAWSFASQLRGHVAGVIGVGAGLPPGMTVFELAPPTEGEPDAAFAFFGGTGRLDFNYEEVRDLEQQLALARIPYWIETWDGPHSWPPEEVGRRAVEWLDLQWSRWRGDTVPHERAAEVVRGATQRAAGLEEEGDLIEAWRVATDVTRTLGDAAGTGEAGRIVDRLAGDRRLEAQRAAADRLARAQREIEEHMWGLLLEFRADPAALAPERVSRELDIQTLLGRVGSGDPRTAASGRRTLETLFVQFSFYQPREWARARDFERARAALAVADLLEPGSPRVCYQRAVVEAGAGALDEAVEALTCAVGAAPGFAAAARAEPLLDPIRDDPRVRALLAPPR